MQDAGSYYSGVCHGLAALALGGWDLACHVCVEVDTLEGRQAGEGHRDALSWGRGWGG